MSVPLGSNLVEVPVSSICRVELKFVALLRSGNYGLCWVSPVLPADCKDFHV